MRSPKQNPSLVAEELYQKKNLKLPFTYHTGISVCVHIFFNVENHFIILS